MSQQDQELQQHKKEGFVHMMIQKGAHRFIIYVEEGMPSFAAFDAAFDAAVHIRNVYQGQVKKAMEDQQANEAQKAK